MPDAVAEPIDLEPSELESHFSATTFKRGAKTQAIDGTHRISAEIRAALAGATLSFSIRGR